MAKSKPKLKAKRPARAGYGATPIVDLPRQASYFGEPIYVPLWWHGPLTPGEHRVCNLTGNQALLGTITLNADDGPGYGTWFNLPAEIEARLERVEFDGSPNVLWDVDAVIRIGEKIYGAGPVGALRSWTFPDACRPVLFDGIALQVELHACRLTFTIQLGVVCAVTLLRPIS